MPGPGPPGRRQPRAPRAAGLPRAHALGRDPCPPDDRQAHPGRRRPGRRERRRRRDAAPGRPRVRHRRRRPAARGRPRPRRRRPRPGASRAGPGRRGGRRAAARPARAGRVRRRAPARPRRPLHRRRCSRRPTARGWRADRADLAARLAAVERAAGTAPFGLPPDLLVNDLEPAARALSEEVGAALETVREAGADVVLLCGSGPTVAGLFADPAAARTARAALAARVPAPLLAGPWRRAGVPA